MKILAANDDDVWLLWIRIWILIPMLILHDLSHISCCFNKLLMIPNESAVVLGLFKVLCISCALTTIELNLNCLALGHG